MPKTKRKKIPEFGSLEEMASFFDTHNSTEYNLEPDYQLIEKWRAHIRVGREKATKNMNFRVTPKLIDRLRCISDLKGIPPQTLAKHYIQMGMLSDEMELSRKFKK